MILLIVHINNGPIQCMSMSTNIYNTTNTSIVSIIIICPSSHSPPFPLLTILHMYHMNLKTDSLPAESTCLTILKKLAKKENSCPFCALTCPLIYHHSVSAESCGRSAVDKSMGPSLGQSLGVTKGALLPLPLACAPVPFKCVLGEGGENNFGNEAGESRCELFSFLADGEERIGRS